jgi:hypothetical protein
MPRVKLNGIRRRGLIEWRARAAWCDRHVLIWSNEHGAYWRPSAQGYTDDVNQAWVLPFPDAFEEVKHCGPEKRIEFVATGAHP